MGDDLQYLCISRASCCILHCSGGFYISSRWSKQLKGCLIYKKGRQYILAPIFAILGVAWTRLHIISGLPSCIQSQGAKLPGQHLRQLFTTQVNIWRVPWQLQGSCSFLLRYTKLWWWRVSEIYHNRKLNFCFWLRVAILAHKQHGAAAHSVSPPPMKLATVTLELWWDNLPEKKTVNMLHVQTHMLFAFCI